MDCLWNFRLESLVVQGAARNVETRSISESISEIKHTTFAYWSRELQVLCQISLLGSTEPCRRSSFVSCLLASTMMTSTGDSLSEGVLEQVPATV